MHHIELIITNLINHFGEWGIFFTMLLESACIPIPSEVIMLFGGFLAASGSLNFWGVILAGTLGNLAGSILIYWIGIKGGRPFIEKYGKFVLFNPHHLEKADRWFQKYGGLTVFFGRILPVIRTFISLPAGISKMKFGRFTLYTILGCIPWNIVLTYAGLKLGQNWSVAQPYLKPFTYIGALIFIIIIIRFIFRSLKSETPR